MTTWKIRSSSGRDVVEGNFLKHIPSSANGESFLATMNTSSVFLERDKDIHDANFVEDYQVFLPQAVLRQDAVESGSKISNLVEFSS